MTKPQLLMTGPMMPLIETGAAATYTVHRLHEATDREAFLSSVTPQVEAICTGGHTGVKTDKALIERCPRLKVIANFGVGYDTIDTAAAAARGIVVTNTPDVLTEEVADTTLGLLIGTVREFYKAERWLRDGRWSRDGDYRLTPASLRGRSVGIAGLGRIGKAIARRCEAFGLPISYYGRSRQSDVAYPYYPDLVSLARAVDTLIIATPGGGGTARMVNAAVLEALGPQGVLINIARGSVVDEPALIDALRRRVIMAAGLDVFVNEPNPDPAFLELDNVMLLPHVGSASMHTRDGMAQLVVDNLAAYAGRKPPLTPVVETPFKSW
ncbi:MAG: 2-hydroxyacid dehydrogenase [Hyphomicrobiaceae bacterium]|nr:2-hydroxyacid dehydrogenase [Hyphomicrobiaceae bacterium]